MITTLVSWIIIFYTLFSLGDLLTFFYNKICRNEESYQLFDTFILGICFTSILLPLSSLWLPSNHYILFIYIAIGTIHWIINTSRLRTYFISVKNFLSSTIFLQQVLITIPIIAVLIYVYIFDHFYDAEYYQYQHIMWNEKFAIVPGLGNLEDRYGFNSNYLLLSAIFTFRFLFGETEAIYSLQSLLYACILCWITISFIRSGYKKSYIILLVIAYLTIVLMGYSLASSSTDIMPLLFIFYYISKSVIDIKWLKTQPLLALLLPVIIITFKLSTITFCLMCLIPFIFLIKEKKYRELSFIFTEAFLAVSLWCVRNVIISGYLIYPLYSIDLFNFDWKVPKGTALLQETHINNYALERFHMGLFNAKRLLQGYIDQVSIEGFLNIIFCIVIIVSPTIVIRKFRKRQIGKESCILYGIILFCIIFNFATAPDFRFNYGYIFGLLAFLAFISLKSENASQSSKSTIILTLIVLCGFCTTATYKLIDAGNRIGVKFDSPMDFVALYHHRNSKNLNSFDEFKMRNIVIYTTKERTDNRTFDKFPATDPNGIPFENFSGLKIQDIRTIELRGNSLQDGFRTKSEYIDIINTNAEKYKLEYYKSLENRE